MAAEPPSNAPSAPSLPLATAEQMISGCVQLSIAERFPPLSIVVIDISGTMVAFRRQDGASPVSSDAALLKARSALRARMPSAALGVAAATDPMIRDILSELQLTGVAGGVLATSPAGDAIGAVGVSGGSPLQDGRCATAAVSTAQSSR